MFEIPNVPSSVVLKEGDFVDPISTKTIEALTNASEGPLGFGKMALYILSTGG